MVREILRPTAVLGKPLTEGRRLEAHFEECGGNGEGFRRCFRRGGEVGVDL